MRTDVGMPSTVRMRGSTSQSKERGPYVPGVDAPLRGVAQSPGTSTERATGMEG